MPSEYKRAQHTKKISQMIEEEFRTPALEIIALLIEGPMLVTTMILASAVYLFVGIATWNPSAC